MIVLVDGLRHLSLLAGIIIIEGDLPNQVAVSTGYTVLAVVHEPLECTTRALCPSHLTERSNNQT